MVVVALPKKLLTIKDVAERLNVSLDTVRRLVWSSSIGYINVNKGGQNIVARFTEQHVLDFLEKSEVKAG